MGQAEPLRTSLGTGGNCWEVGPGTARQVTNTVKSELLESKDFCALLITDLAIHTAVTKYRCGL